MLWKKEGFRNAENVFFWKLLLFCVFFFHTESCKFFFPRQRITLYPLIFRISQLRCSIASYSFLQRTGVLFTHLVITMFLFIVLYGNVSFLLLFHREPGCVFHDYSLFIYLPSQHPITTGSPAQPSKEFSAVLQIERFHPSSQLEQSPQQMGVGLQNFPGFIHPTHPSACNILPIL